MVRKTIADYPELVSQWHPIKNGDLKPANISRRSRKKIWWKCYDGEWPDGSFADDHEWKISANNKSSKCPFCSRKRVCHSNSLKATHPELILQLHPTKNGNFDATRVLSGTAMKVWWQCVDGHEWHASIANRTHATNPRGCPHCYTKTFKKPTKQVFLEFYSTHTFDECCKHFKVKSARIFNWRKQFGIGTKLELRNEKLCLTSRQIQILEGSLLGDGSLSAPKKFSHFREMHCWKQADYVDFKGQELGEFTSNISTTWSHGKKRRSLESIGHPQITALEQQWYKRDSKGNYILNHRGYRTKIIPPHLKLTPLTIAIWYCDDGWHSPKDRSAHLCTNGFAFDETEFLVIKLKEFDISCWVQSRFQRKTQKFEPQIYIGPQSYKSFIQMITPHVSAPSMQYKVDLSNYTESQHQGYKPKGYWSEQTVLKHLMSYKEFPRRSQLDGSLLNAIKHYGGFKYFRHKFGVIKSGG